jgi:hypothetical protein
MTLSRWRDAARWPRTGLDFRRHRDRHESLTERIAAAVMPMSVDSFGDYRPQQQEQRSEIEQERCTERHATTHLSAPEHTPHQRCNATVTARARDRCACGRASVRIMSTHRHRHLP